MKTDQEKLKALVLAFHPEAKITDRAIEFDGRRLLFTPEGDLERVLDITRAKTGESSWKRLV